MEWAEAGNVLPVMPPMTEGQRESHRENTVGLSLSIVKELTALTRSWRVEPLLLNHSVKAPPPNTTEDQASNIRTLRGMFKPSII